jgi:hypothetical protein
MKQKRIIKFIILLVLVITVLLSLSACSFFEDYNINSIGDFFEFVGFLFGSLIGKIVFEVVEFFKMIF